MTRKQQKKIDLLDKRIDSCVQRLMEDPKDGALWIKHLVLAEQVRALKNVRPLAPIRISGDDEKAQIARRVSVIYMKRQTRNIQQAIDWVDEMMRQEGGISKPGVDRTKARYRKEYERYVRKEASGNAEKGGE